jgi:ectoine hydroxylase-related dioxygenase (phytanoyl-CoA dioxygenase family)
LLHGKQLNSEDAMQRDLSTSEIDQFRRDGFINIRQACSREETAEIRKVLEDLYARKVGVKEGAQFDVLRPAEAGAITLGQVTNPSDFAPALRKTAYFRRACALASQILGPKAFNTIDLVLMKPAFEGAATPWHQDQAYRKLNYDYDEITLWLPLQDVDENSGCMQFVPGTHKGQIKPHQSPNGDVKAHSLESCYTPSPDEIVSVPMQLGDCSIHDGRVLHGSPGNRSSVTRYAYILIFRNPTAPPKTATPYAWVQQRRDAASERREAWLRHGGILVLLWRKLRRGGFANLSRTRLMVMEGMLRFQRRWH